jgi:AFG3 family protein
LYAGFENFYPKNKKELPKSRTEQKSESKNEDPKSEDPKTFTEVPRAQLQSLILTGAVTVAILTTLSIGRSDAQQVPISILLRINVILDSPIP